MDIDSDHSDRPECLPATLFHRRETLFTTYIVVNWTLYLFLNYRASSFNCSLIYYDDHQYHSAHSMAKTESKRVRTEGESCKTICFLTFFFVNGHYLTPTFIDVWYRNSKFTAKHVVYCGFYRCNCSVVHFLVMRT